MTRRISVGKRLAEDMVAKRRSNSNYNESEADALFGALAVSDNKVAGHSYLVVLISTAEYEDAYKIAHALVSQRKAASVNILPTVSSIFWWRNEVEEAEQSFLLVNTRMDLFQDVLNLVKSINSYEVPEIVALPVIQGSWDYMEWMDKVTERRTEIKIAVGGIELKAWLNGVNIAARVLETLPLTSKVSLWGGELYFPVPMENELEHGKETVNIGDIAYWPTGKAICIFLGGTPMSKGEEIRPLNPVEVIGRVEVPQGLLGKVRRGEKITIWR